MHYFHFVLCFQMQCFQYTTLCFQYKTYVSNIQFLFPISYVCFQYPIFVSNIQSMFPNANDVSKRHSFQCMFPIYMEPSKSKNSCFDSLDCLQLYDCHISLVLFCHRRTLNLLQSCQLSNIGISPSR